MANNTELPKELQQKLDTGNREELYNTLKDFYDMGGVMLPVENITNLLQNFFSSVDPESEGEDGKPLPNFKSWNANYVSDLVYQSCEMIKFFVKLNDAWDSFPENPRNRKSQN